MNAPPWGHKPAAVPDSCDYWVEPPPVRSARCDYWLRRLREGSWHPNKYLLGEGYHEAAHAMGVYIWEWIEVLGPACYAGPRGGERNTPTATATARSGSPNGP